MMQLISGSNVFVKNIQFDSVGDKVISAGENSKINISNILANNSYIGIAAKDGSNVMAKNIIMDKVKILFSVYNKKFEYSIPNLVLENIELKDLKKNGLLMKILIFYMKIKKLEQ